MTLDSNVLAYAITSSDPSHTMASELIARAARGDCRPTLQSFAECFNVLRREYQMPAAEALRWVEFPVIAADERDLVAAMRAVEDHRLSFWEAMLWASARRAGCRMLFSEDLQDGGRLGDMLVVNPLDPANRKLVDLALPEIPS